ncbi:YALIA101S01e10924g1_1 [Yarrowia lipolytica]|nr:YALIA101S01e10924g1_1 [Yarrowia lipolytica]
MSLFLETAKLTASAQIHALETLLASSPAFCASQKEDILHILLVLTPELLDPKEYMGLVNKVGKGQLDKGQDTGSVVGDEGFIPELVIKSREQKLLAYLDSVVPKPVHNFLEERIRLVFKVSHDTQLMEQLILQSGYHNNSEEVDWVAGVPQVLINYTRLHGINHGLTIDELENGDPSHVIELLGSHLRTPSAEDDLQLVLEPYVAYKNCWAVFRDFVIHVTQSNTPLLATLAHNVTFPESERDAFIQIVLKNSFEANDTQWDALALITESPAVTGASHLTSHFTKQLVETCRLLEPAIPSITLQRANKVTTSGEEVQVDLLDDFVFAEDWLKRTSDQWQTFITATEVLVSLKTVFSTLSDSQVNQKVFEALLGASQFEIAKTTYILGGLVDSEFVEKAILAQFYTFYDAATNGNHTRGSMKSAKLVLGMADTNTRTKHQFKVAQCLLEATNTLSNYSLTLKPGTLTRPVDIRNHDALQVMDRVLDLNPDAYKNCPKLIHVTRQLLDGLDKSESISDADIETRIYTQAVTAALVHDDFDTAQKLCAAHELPWTAYFQVGKYVSPSRDMDELVALKLETLSTALAKCPPEHLSAVLHAWRDVEEMMVSLPESRESVVQPSVVLADVSREAGRKRDQLSSMLVSGLGWAIGANKE